MTAHEGYFGEECPRCLAWTGEGVDKCPACAYPVPLGYVLPYDDPPWEYDDALVSDLRRHEALRLMARYGGKAPHSLGELRHCRRLYLSRYKGFDLAFLRGFEVLDTLELDAAPIVDLDGIEGARPLWVLKLTECRTLERIEALAGCREVKLLALTLCNRVRDHAPIARMTGLRSLFIEARELASLEFVRGLRDLRSIALGVQKIGAGGIEPLLDLEGLQHIAVRKRLVKPPDIARMRDRWPEASLVFD